MSLDDLKRIDAHCHVNFPAYGDEAESVIARALAGGTGMVCVGTELGTSRSAVAVAEAHDGIWAAVGFHPSHLHERHHDDDELGERVTTVFDADAFRGLIRSSRKIVAIGECGLDRHGLPPEADASDERHGQADLFRAHLDLALEFGLPVIVHCRDLHGEVCAILEEYREAGRTLRGVAHCFTGSVAEARRYLDLGFYVSFTGTVTYPPRRAEKDRGETAVEVVRSVPLERMLIETDAPYLAPAPNRGERNEPDYVRLTAARIAEIIGLPVEKVEATTKANTIELFRLG
jgi:TatD DNase family protein